MAVLIGAAAAACCAAHRFTRISSKPILTINTSWSSTCRMAAALVAEPGGGAFPRPEAILEYGEERLRQHARLGFRAPTVISATRQLLAEDAHRPVGQMPARAPRSRLSDQSQGHRALRRRPLPAAVARFQPDPGRFGGRRRSAPTPWLRPGRVRREPGRTGAPIWRSATGSSACAKNWPTPHRNESRLTLASQLRAMLADKVWLRRRNLPAGSAATVVDQEEALMANRVRTVRRLLLSLSVRLGERLGDRPHAGRCGASTRRAGPIGRRSRFRPPTRIISTPWTAASR